MWVKWNLVSVCWEPVLVQDRCTVCAKHTIGSEIILDSPDGTPNMGHVDSGFGLVGDSVAIGER